METNERGIHYFVYASFVIHTLIVCAHICYNGYDVFGTHHFICFMKFVYLLCFKASSEFSSVRL